MLRRSCQIIRNSARSIKPAVLIPCRFESSTSEHVAFKPHFDYKAILANIDLYRESMKVRNYSSVDIDLLQEMIEKRDVLQAEVFLLRAYRNNIATRMKQLNSKNPNPIGNEPFRLFGSIEGEIDLNTATILDLVHEGKRVKALVKDVEDRLDEVEAVLVRSASLLPNLTHPKTPIGDESYATLLGHHNPDKGTLDQYINAGFIPKDHTEIAKLHGLIDFESAAKVTGSRFYYLYREAALLEMALINYTFGKLVSKGFVPVTSPDLVRTSVVEGAGFQSKDEKTLDQHIFQVQNSDLSLAATAEIPMAGRFINDIIPEAELPIKTVAFSHCFRTEAGRGGTQVKGLYRVHQFSKVEMFVVCTPAQAEALHEEIINIEKEIFTDLGLNFRVLDMPTLDLGAPAYRKVDIEACMPGRAVSLYKAATATSMNSTGSTAEIQKIMDSLVQNVDDLKYIDNVYGEISSASNCTDYQARRLNIRYKPEEITDGGTGTTRFVYTLNGTACAVPRMIVAIFEQNQRPDGTVALPEVLKPFMFGNTQIPFTNRPF